MLTQKRPQMLNQERPRPGFNAWLVSRSQIPCVVVALGVRTGGGVARGALIAATWYRGVGVEVMSH